MAKKGKYANEATLDAVLEIMYNALKEKAGVDQLQALEESITEIQQSATNHLTVDDVLKTFEDYNTEADADKVVAASLFKEIVEKLENGDFGGKIEEGTYVETKDVISNWDDLNEEVMQVVSATLIKALSEKVTSLEETIGDADSIVRVGEDGKVPSDVLPGYVDDVVDVYLVEETDEEGNVTSRIMYGDEEHTTEVEPEGSKIYNDVSREDGASWRWSGSQLVKISSDDLVPITREEVRAMWEAIEIPEEDDEEEVEEEVPSES